MRNCVILIILFLSCLTVYGQKLELKKASPFTAVTWEGEQPIVEFENNWYHFEKLASLSKEEILSFCKREYDRKWQKRFSEDLVEVLQGLDYEPNIQEPLVLSQKGINKEFIGTFTLENRQRVLRYTATLKNAEIMNKGPQKMSVVNALADLREFQQILTETSSYARLTAFDYNNAIELLAVSIKNGNTEVDVNEFTHKLAKIMSEIGDRHSSIRNESFQKEGHPNYNLRLPFGVAVLKGRVVATQQQPKTDHYMYYDAEYPYLVRINGISATLLIDQYNYRAQKAPTLAKLSRGSSAIQKYGELMFKNMLDCPEKVEVVLGNGATEKTLTVQLTNDRKGYLDPLIKNNYVDRYKMEKGNLIHLSKRLVGNIGYFNIPVMFHYDEIEALESEIEKALEDFSDMKAVIIDVRNNPGGGREILQTFSKYIVQKDQAPWVANVAYLRTDKVIEGDEESMLARYLYDYKSSHFSNADRIAIDRFNKNFEPNKEFDKSKFSQPFYMVLDGSKKLYAPSIYILANERSFSAATVFVSAFKGLPNVQIVGTTTDGSSGNSRTMYLKNSNIRVKVSTMLSFQRNGATLDGNGTVPDLVIPADESQVLRGEDHQLEFLTKYILKND